MERGKVGVTEVVFGDATAREEIVRRSVEICEESHLAAARRRSSDRSHP